MGTPDRSGSKSFSPQTRSQRICQVVTKAIAAISASDRNARASSDQRVALEPRGLLPVRAVAPIHLP
jgi:hypothetical protein